MQNFGGTCPMCCGDVAKEGTEACIYCGFLSETDRSPEDRVDSPRGHMFMATSAKSLQPETLAGPLPRPRAQSMR